MQDYSLKVLHWRPGDIKALYRAGVATLELGDAHTARQYLLQASRGKPNGKNMTQDFQLWRHFWRIQLCRILRGCVKVVKGRLNRTAVAILSSLSHD